MFHGDGHHEVAHKFFKFYAVLAWSHEGLCDNFTVNVYLCMFLFIHIQV